MFSWNIILILFVFLSIAINPLFGCTGIMLQNEDNTFVHGRTGEFGYFLETDVAVIPRNYEIVGETPEGDGLKFNTKYASIGLIAFDVLGSLDGINEKGLSFGAFYFPGYAEYATITNENQSRAVSPSQFGNWVLGQFSTVDEVKSAIENEEVVIAPTTVKGFGPEAPPFHYIVYDLSGKSIVIEPLEGKLVVTDTPLGVFTNSPTIDWHYTNLRNYIELNPFNSKPVEVRGVSFKQFGQGSGMMGLPGDFTPPSRFVRAAVFSTTAIPSKNADDGIKQVFHILNNFDIPVGAVREKSDDTLYTDYTIITVARDPQNHKFYYKTYTDQSLRVVDLIQFDLDAKEVKKYTTGSIQPIIDMSSRLQN